MLRQNLLAVLAAVALLSATPVLAASDVVSEAQALINQGRLEQALTLLESHLESAPQDAEARFSRGLVLVRLNRSEEAVKAFADLTRDYPQLPEPYNNLAVIYAQQGEYEKARSALEAALTTHPSYAVAHENLGDIYAALAAAAYNRAMTLDSRNTSVRAKLNLVNQLDSLADSGAGVSARPSLKVSEEPATESPPTPDSEALAQTVRDWAAAWSAKDVEKYLAFYAAGYAPEGGGSRAAWETQRRSRIGKPRQIRVTVSDLQFARLPDDRVRITFQQDYASDALTNRVTKVLELKNAGDGWRILREYSR
ncbi:MAG: tetratricopeptide repeat protein [Hydrocarboniphaga effusa]|nr:tetratricopeptide repeat protein [Hydrocarboniphaga effusa]